MTHGVGALSAINGIAGAYSEHVPVICISGSIPLQAIQRGDLMHHTLAEREKGNFCRMFAEVTGAQAQLSSERARHGRFTRQFKSDVEIRFESTRVEFQPT